MDARTEELRAAHDGLAAFYVEHLAGALERMPVERAVLDLFCELTRAEGVDVGDVGCGTGRLEPYLASKGLAPRGVDLSPEMVRVARRDYPGFSFEVADLRSLPFEDDSLVGVVCWYSLIFLAPPDRPAAFAELARVIRPGGYLVTAYKLAEQSRHRRAGGTTGLGVEFDQYWQTPSEMESSTTGAGFETVFWGGLPAEKPDSPDQGYLLVRKKSDGPGH